MVGEIRDGETAGLAINASLTGHLVLSTIHANDAAGTLPRLIDLGANVQIIGPALNLIMAQRLVRTICPKCRTGFKPDAVMLKALEADGTIPMSNTVLYKGAGCADCSGTI